MPTHLQPLSSYYTFKIRFVTYEFAPRRRQEHHQFGG